MNWQPEYRRGVLLSAPVDTARTAVPLPRVEDETSAPAPEDVQVLPYASRWVLTCGCVTVIPAGFPCSKTGFVRHPDCPTFQGWPVPGQPGARLQKQLAEGEDPNAPEEPPPPPKRKYREIPSPAVACSPAGL